MIAEESKKHIEIAFQNAIRTSLVRDSQDVCDITQSNDDPRIEYTGGHWLFLTLSSFAFRLQMIFRVIDNPLAQAYFVGVASALSLDEVMPELVNLCGGAMNRDMSQTFPHLAISTPSKISSACLAYLRDLKPQHLASYEITINKVIKLRAKLCLCCSVPISVDAAVTRSNVPDNVGEIEIF